ncbi:MAG: DNA mismatch repair endonuclease MutL [Thermoguttaceae bacterium]
MARIQRLPPGLINKIAAGEVVERPASVVKELMENALDAGASRIDVAVEAGGIELVRVVDNGCGIPAEELPLAVAPHATSKIASDEDLFRIATLGFRGEALASIGEVSRLVLRSRTADSPSGAEISVCGGQPSAVTPCGCPVGTSVEVRNLFFNTPVRRKFLRSMQTELGHTSEAFIRIALAAPHVHFTLRNNDRPVFELSPSEAWLERIARIFGQQLAEQLIWIESRDGPVRLSGYVAHPAQSRSHNRMQYLFLNGRWIRDRSLQHALGEAYRGLLTAGRYPIAILALQMPPELADVNVHPTKLEVRFQDSSRLYSQLLGTLRSKFLSTDLMVRAGVEAEQGPAAAHDQSQEAWLRQELVDWAKGTVATWQKEVGSAEGPLTGGESQGEASPAPARPLELTRLDRPWAPAALPSARLPVGPGRRGPAQPPQTALPHQSHADKPVKALQVHNRYLVAESEEGVMVIDQHALHERILYEQLRRRVAAGPIDSQSLLVPEPVDLTPAEAAAALEYSELLAQLGIRIDPFGGDTLLIQSYPAMLANFPPQVVLRGVLEPLLAAGKAPDRRDLLDSLLHTIACKAAVKAGDRLTPEEVATLVEQRHLIADPHHCPHGRPAAVILTREDLDRQFKRS